MSGLGDFYLETDWMRAAACRGRHDVNFCPSKIESDAAAKAVCSTCPVVEPCYEYAMKDSSIVGIWGGTSGIGRRRIREATERARKSRPSPPSSTTSD